MRIKYKVSAGARQSSDARLFYLINLIFMRKKNCCTSAQISLREIFCPPVRVSERCQFFNNEYRQKRSWIVRATPLNWRRRQAGTRAAGVGSWRRGPTAGAT
jgi:hypothetical protein